MPTVRSFFGIACIVCLVLWALFTLLLDPSILLRYVHTDEHEWLSMYVNLALHLHSGLLCAAAILLVVTLALEKIREMCAQLLRLPAAYFLAIVLGAQALVCCVWLFVFPADIWADGITYHRLAVGLASGAGYVGEDGHLTAYYPVGYPLILSLLYRVFGTSLWVGKLANVAMVLALTSVWYRISRKVWNETTARGLLILLLCSLSVVSYTSILFSEIAFLLFFSLAIRGVVEFSNGHATPGWLAFVGVMTGVAALIRPVALLLPLAYGIACMRGAGERWKTIARMAVVYAAAFVVLLPNIIRNYGAFDSFIPISTNGGINFWIGNNPKATGYYVPPTNVHLTGNEVEQSRQAYALGMEWILSHPGTAAGTAVKKFFHLYHRDDQGILFSVVRSLRDPSWTAAVAAIILDNIVYYLIFVLAMRYGIRNRRALSHAEYFLILLCLFVTGFHLLYFGAHRFHFPLYPIFAAFAAAGVAPQFERKTTARDSLT